MPAASSHSKNQPSRHEMSVILVTGSYDHEIRFWEAWSGICSRTIPRESGQVNRLAISHDKRFLAAAIHKKLHIYDITSNSNEPLVVFEGHSNNITCIAFNIEGKWIVSGGEDGTIKIWDLRNPTAPARVYENAIGVNDICIHPNQGELITCDQGGSIKQWDLSDNICSHELTPAGDVPMRSISLATDGSCLVAGNDKGQCYVWKLNDEASGLPRFQAITRFTAHSKYLTRCLLSPDARFLATCSADTTVKIWSVGPGYEIKPDKVLVGHQRWVWDCAFSADSAYLVTASSDHTARLWEMSTGETVRQYNGHHKAAVCCALHDGAS